MLEELQIVWGYVLYFLNMLTWREKISIALFVLAGVILAGIVIDFYERRDKDDIDN